ncbi:MAG: type II toxin-antitoxin system PemK/MazF family toxin [Nitrospirae bacterium]|nr:type II toxin-antitoxin system PemK/MazF family toxin [Nitrospirota bacterium]
MTGYKFGDVVLIDFLQSTGDKKRRPALVILDTGDEDIVLVPITTKERNGQGDYKLIDWNESGLLRESWVRLAKITSLSKDDILCSLGQLREYDQKEIIVLWQRLYKLQLNPP